MRCHQLLAASAVEHPDRVAVHWVDRDRSLTYTEAVDAMLRGAAALHGFGVAAGGRVGMFAHPGLDYVVGLLSTWRLGAAVAPVGLESKESFGELMASMGPDAVIYTNDHYDHVRSAMAALPSVKVYTGMDGPQEGTIGWLDALAAADPDALPADVSDDGAALILAGEVIEHGALLGASTALADALSIDESDITMCPAPLAGRFHIEASILPALSRGATAGMLKTWDPAAGWEAMEAGGSTIFCGLPSHCRDLLDASARHRRPPSALRAAVTSSVVAAAELAPHFRTELGVEILPA